MRASPGQLPILQGVTYPSPPPDPYQPFAIVSPLRAIYRSLVQVQRLTMVVTAGAPNLTWNTISDLLDPFVEIPGQMMCKIDLAFTRAGGTGAGALSIPIAAGRAPDRVGTVIFDAQMNPATNAPYVLAGDRINCIAGPVFGTFEIREIPYAASDFFGAHHIEVGIAEVAQSLAKGSPTPFPGSEGPDT